MSENVPEQPVLPDPGDGLSPENLPPVQPPSAGFIFQLFVVPAIIVGAVFGLVTMFGSLASTDLDWRRQVVELKQSNEHRRWRGAQNLAQMLQADSQAGADSAHLADDPELAAALAENLKPLLKASGKSEADKRMETFLLVALGWMNTREVTFPVLIEAMELSPSTEPISNSEENPFDNARFSAITAAGMVAGRLQKAGTPLGAGEMLNAILKASRDRDPVIRQISAHALGFFAADATRGRLLVLLEDGDQSVRANAATSLAAQHSTLGLPVLVELLQEVVETPDPLKDYDSDDTEEVKTANNEEIYLIRIAKNALKAVGNLAPQLTEGEKKTVRPWVVKLSKDFRNTSIRVIAYETLEKLDAQ